MRKVYNTKKAIAIIKMAQKYADFTLNFSLNKKYKQINGRLNANKIIGSQSISKWHPVKHIDRCLQHEWSPKKGKPKCLI